MSGPMTRPEGRASSGGSGEARPPYPPWAVDPSSDRQPGPEDCLKEVDEWWWKLWAPTPTKVADLSRAEAILNSLPPFPALRPLSVRAVLAAIKTSPKSKAPGMGWALLPRNLVVALRDG